MADDKDTVVTSDTEAPEKRTREQLKKATISKVSGETKLAAEVPTEEDGSSHSNGLPEADVSAEKEIDTHGRELTREPVSTGARHHSRKRSRDSTLEEEELNNGQRKSGERARGESKVEVTSNGAPKPVPTERQRTPERTGGKRGEAAVEAMTSPKTKKSRLHSEPETTDDKGETVSKDSTSVEQETQKPAPSVPPTSGFANTSASSPFASLSGTKSPPSDTPQSTSSAFASSGFGSLSASSTSGFGAKNKSSGGFGTGGSFASPSKTDAPSKAESSSAFGGALGQQSAFSSSAQKPTTSVFASASPSGFGTLSSGSAFGGGGSGFGTLGGGGGLTSFASGKPSASLAGPSKAAKSFGAPANDAEEGDDDDDRDGDGEDDAGFKSPLSQGESDKQDERFYRQDLETGEEDERMEYSCRAKLYNFVTGPDGKKEWKERGLGVVKLNVRDRESETDEASLSARLLMRADGSHRVMLNTPVKKELKFGAAGGGPPQGGLLLFMGAVDGKKDLEMMQLKVRQQFATELYERIVELQEAM